LFIVRRVNQPADVAQELFSVENPLHQRLLHVPDHKGSFLRLADFP
jgi:hypothetical protein